ncbi:hypothetical protein CAI21_06885 [Alkalilimnicola ehrlichii]|uniref:Cell division protein FtsQ n=1 Tax=Alkalilimnicola ehrlichii TaxID=351052 RepID=A0A3E0X0G0_9GAMM|nr:cell division protein FtsQ/DivIB [Alkalilimnicola ehrlichii]RFA30326.1 hypothetical protein CAI21_06885 [Alkalilimnicola ehrlichii]RFA37901.1 hypothetical protein CAL65_08230 [Alkalilimnicola ehrlichii]
MATPAASIAKRVAQTEPAPRRNTLRAVRSQDKPRPPYRRYALAVAVLMMLGFGLDAGWRWLMSPEVFPLQAVSVESRLQQVSEEEIRAAIEPHVDRGMLGLDVRSIRESLEGLSWVATASVRRQWPGTLALEIEEQVALARWNDEEALNPSGDVFAAGSARLANDLPSLRGPEGSGGKVAERYRQLSDLLAPLGFTVTAVTLDDRLVWRAVLNDEIDMQLGAEQDDAVLRRFVRTYPRLAEAADGSLASVDLRYPNGFALRWHEPGGAR